MKDKPGGNTSRTETPDLSVEMGNYHRLALKMSYVLGEQAKKEEE